jgi:hypothetical protein
MKSSLRLLREGLDTSSFSADLQQQQQQQLNEVIASRHHNGTAPAIYNACFLMLSTDQPIKRLYRQHSTTAAAPCCPATPQGPHLLMI